jgi:hypothetical protein
MAPTFETTDSFRRDQKNLSPEQAAKARLMVEKFVQDLKPGNGFRKGLRVKGVEGAPGVYEVTFNGDGRATFQYGTEKLQGHEHIIWRRIGTHDVFKNA